MANDPSKLTPEEEHLVDCAAHGEWWRPKTAGSNRIRAELIRCLIVGEALPSEAKTWPVHSRGLLVGGAFIFGTLDLEGATLIRSLWLHGCEFNEQVLIRSAESLRISLQGSKLLKGLAADHAHIKGDLDLSYGFSASDEVHLGSAKIEGRLDCSSGTFRHRNGPAIYADGITVGADVFMRNEFSADGCVNFTRAMIGGQFDCVGGRFENAGDISLLANAITVGADVFLRQGFSAKGEVNLVRANIGGELDCDGGRFESKNGYALNMDSARVGEDIFFRHGFSAAGQLNLTRVNVRGNIRFEDCSCEGSGQVAIYLSHAEIGAGLFFRSFRKRDGGGQGLNGLLFLDQTRCRTFSDDRDSWPEPGMLVLDGFTYERFHDCEDIGWKARCDWLRLQVYAHLNILRSQPWQQASKVLRDMGHEDDAREIAVQREVARVRSADTRGIRKIWMIFLGAAVGFGYRPRYALYWSLGFFLLGWLTFAEAYDLGYMAPRDGSVVAYLAANPGKPVPSRYTEFNSFLYAADTFLPIIELGQDSAWEPSTVRAPDATPLPTDRSPSSVTARNLAQDFSIGVHRWIYWMEEMVGWVLVSLFIAGMSGVIKKD